MSSQNVLVATKKGTLPAAGNNILSTAIKVSPIYSKMRVDFAASVAGILTVTFPGSSDSYTVYGGASLPAGSLYPFDVAVDTGETVNFQFSGTGGTYRLMVSEAP